MAYLRKTPYERLRYPWSSDVVAVGDVASMANDIDQALVTTAKMGSDFQRFASVSAYRSTTQSITKGTPTAISFNATVVNNGANSPLANGVWWSGSAPTRVTAPVACVALVSGSAGMNLGSALGTAGCVQVTVRLNGGSWQQGSKYSPTSAVTGQQWTSGLSLWPLAAGDYLELMMFWTGSPAGPFNTDSVVPPTLSLMMVGLPSVP